MLKICSLTSTLAFILNSTDAQRSSAFKLTDIGFGYAVQSSFKSTPDYYSPFLNDVSELENSGGPGFYPNGAGSRGTTSGKQAQAQITLTQKENGCLVKKAKAIRITLAYINQNFTPFAARRIDYTDDMRMEERMERSRMKGIRTEVELRRILPSSESEIRAFGGIGLQGEFTLSHKAEVSSHSVTVTHTNYTSTDANGISTTRQFDNETWRRNGSYEVTFDNSKMVGVYLCAGLYWPVTEGFAMELEFKMGKQSRKFPARSLIYQNFCAIGISGRILIK